MNVSLWRTVRCATQTLLICLRTVVERASRYQQKIHTGSSLLIFLPLFPDDLSYNCCDQETCQLTTSSPILFRLHNHLVTKFESYRYFESRYFGMSGHCAERIKCERSCHLIYFLSCWSIVFYIFSYSDCYNYNNSECIIKQREGQCLTNTTYMFEHCRGACFQVRGLSMSRVLELHWAWAWACAKQDWWNG